MAFNAGIWGYPDWKTTLTYLQYNYHHPTIMVMTAYTYAECQEDYQVILDTVGPKTSHHHHHHHQDPSIVAPTNTSTTTSTSTTTTTNGQCLWTPEPNPFASRILRETKSKPTSNMTTPTSKGDATNLVQPVDDSYRENAAWQAWYLGSHLSQEAIHK